MFNTKLKKQIIELQLRVWKLENPPLYKIGDKIKQDIVVNVEFIKRHLSYKYTFYNPKTKQTVTSTF